MKRSGRACLLVEEARRSLRTVVPIRRKSASFWQRKVSRSFASRCFLKIKPRTRIRYGVRARARAHEGTREREHGERTDSKAAQLQGPRFEHHWPDETPRMRECLNSDVTLNAARGKAPLPLVAPSCLTRVRKRAESILLASRFHSAARGETRETAVLFLAPRPLPVPQRGRVSKRTKELTSVAASHPARITAAVLTRSIQRILSRIFLSRDPDGAPLARRPSRMHAHEFTGNVEGDRRETTFRVRRRREGSIPAINVGTDEPLEGEGGRKKRSPGTTTRDTHHTDR